MLGCADGGSDFSFSVGGEATKLLQHLFTAADMYAMDRKRPAAAMWWKGGPCKPTNGSLLVDARQQEWESRGR